MRGGVAHTPEQTKLKFASKVKVDANGCWIWQGTLYRNGYGQIKILAKNILAHRYAYTTYVGSIGDMNVLHKCDVRCCVNPDHLFLGTQKENMEDKVMKGRHPLGSDSTTSKLTPEQARFALEMKGKISQVKLGKMFGVSPSAIQQIHDGNNWRCL